MLGSCLVNCCSGLVALSGTSVRFADASRSCIRRVFAITGFLHHQGRRRREVLVWAEGRPHGWSPPLGGERRIIGKLLQYCLRIAAPFVSHLGILLADP